MSAGRALVEHNRYRVKTLKQFANEGTLLETVRLVRNPGNQPKRENFPTLEEGRQRDAIASSIGLGSGKQWDKLKSVKVIADDKSNPLRPVAQQALDTSKTVHQAWTTVREAERKAVNEETARKNVDLAGPQKKKAKKKFPKTLGNLTGMRPNNHQLVRYLRPLTNVVEGTRFSPINKASRGTRIPRLIAPGDCGTERRRSV